MKRKTGPKKAPDAQAQQAGNSNAPSAPPPKPVVYGPQRSNSHYNQIFLFILLVRLASAAYNLIHDCDEVFNFLEPLHFMTEGFGLQTWEHSSKFALRSYFYLLIHVIAVKPMLVLAKMARMKYMAFYGFRALLGAASAYAETQLYKAVVEFGMKTAASYFLVFLITSTGMFCASTTFLPSTTSMVALTYSAAHFLQSNNDHPGLTPSQRLVSIGQLITGACVATALAWPVCGVAFLPYALWVLIYAPKIYAFGTLFTSLAIVLLPSFYFDQFFYGRPTLAIYNFVKYNVFGGGDSHLYGVEGPLYYLQSGLLNFNGVWLLALAFPVLAGLDLLFQHAQSSPTGIHASDAPPSPSPANAFYIHKVLVILITVAPVYVWSGALILLPHKEERFLYVVYPLICLAAGVSLQMLEVFGRAVIGIPKSAINRLVVAGLALTAIVSFMRTSGLLMHYGAPIEIWSKLPVSPPEPLALPVPMFPPSTSVVCVGGEWHRFPSSFFLPSNKYRIGFLKTSFDGMLPTHFNEQRWPFGGTRSAPSHLNDRNKEHPLQYIRGLQYCSYLVQLHPSENFLSEETQEEWKLVRTAKFLNASASPTLGRILYVPGEHGESQNVYSTYQLYKRIERPALQAGTKKNFRSSGDASSAHGAGSAGSKAAESAKEL